MTSKTIAFLCGLLFIPLSASAQFSPPAEIDLRTLDRNTPVPIARLSDPIVLDGPSYEEAWEAVPPFPLTMYAPTFGLEPTERTEIRAAYDDNYLYFSIRAYDSEPDRIRGNILRRDQLGSDDYFEVILDTFNDNENAVVFTTSPAGTRLDAEIARDASGPNWLNRDWNAHWDTAVQVTDDGWFAEMRIPFSSIRFRDESGRVHMGLTVFRVIARKDEWAIFPPIEPTTNLARLMPSRTQAISLEGVYSRTPLYVTPYGVAGITRHAALNSGGTAYEHLSGREGDVGADVKIGLTNQLTLDLTVNTDFAQVEADDEQVNLTRFSLFFPEKRQFFQERAGTFDFQVGGGGRLFHSRRIGLTNDGQPVPILGGARLVGRIGEWDVGLLNMQTAESDLLPSENFGVLRLKRGAFNPYSFIGSALTTRLDGSGTYNVAYGLDGVFRLIRDDYLTLQWAQTFDQATEDLDVHSGRFSALFERRNREGLAYTTNLIWSGTDFNPGVGFIRRRDFTQLEQSFAFGWLPGPTSDLNFHAVEIEGVAFLRNADRSVETVEAGPSWTFTRKSGASGGIGVNVVYENLLHAFPLSSDAHVPAGTYTFYQGSVSYRMSRNRLLRTGVQLSGGTFFDGRQISAGITPAWNVSPHLELGGSYRYHWIDFQDRNQRFEGHVAQLRITTALNTQISTNVFVQYNSAARAVTTNARFRYNFGEGNDLWIVYNEALNTERHRFHPEPPFSGNRALLLKYTYTFQTSLGG